MTITALLVAVIVAGLIVWAINQLPIEPTFQRIAYVIVVVFLILYVLQAFGLMGSHIVVR